MYATGAPVRIGKRTVDVRVPHVSQSTSAFLWTGMKLVGSLVRYSVLEHKHKAYTQSGRHQVCVSKRGVVEIRVRGTMAEIRSAT